jgi:hypothetical protein
MREKAFIGFAGILVALSAEAVSPDSSYRVIVDRNVFALQPLTKQTEIQVPSEPLAKIIPTGVTTVLGRKLALFKVQPAAKSPQGAKEEAFTLAEGERAGEIEVVRIDENAGVITFRNRGNLIALSLEKDGAKPPSTPAPPPGNPALANAPVNMPLPVPNAPAYHTNAALRNLPIRQPPTAPALQANPAVQVNPAAPPAPQAAEKPLTPEEQIILMEIERERSKGQVQNGALPPLPPTRIAPQ